MKKWNAPEIAALDLNKTENGFPWFTLEYTNCLLDFGEPAEVNNGGQSSQPNQTAGDQIINDGQNQQTSGTGDVNSAS